MWDENYEGSTNIVDLYVGCAAAQARRHPALIHTVRGVGFRLEPES